MEQFVREFMAKAFGCAIEDIDDAFVVAVVECFRQWQAAQNAGA